MLIVGGVVHAEQVDHAKEIQQNITEWGKQQLTDTIKGIFKPKQDEQAEINRISFGITIIEIGYLMAYGWLVSFIMPNKIAGLMRTTAILSSIEITAEYIYIWLKS